MKKFLAWFGVVAVVLAALAMAVPALPQNPQTQTAPIYSVNAKYTNGTAPGYWATQQSILNGSGGTIAAATGLHINVGPGTSNCGSGTMISYAGGTFTMTASATNRIYLNTSSSCAVTVKTSAFVGSDIPLAVVVTSGSAITSITDERTIFNVPSGASVAWGVITGTLSDQTDLQAALDAKAAASSTTTINSVPCALNGSCTIPTGSSNPNGRVITTSTTAACGEYLRSDASGAITVTLPAVTTGCTAVVQRNGAGVVTIDPNGATYDGVTNELVQGTQTYIWTDGTGYHSTSPVVPGAHCSLTTGVTNIFDCSGGSGGVQYNASSTHYAVMGASTPIVSDACAVAGSLQASVSSYSITSNVITFNYPSNSVIASGNVLMGSIFPTSTFLNNQNFTLLTATTTSATANFTHANTSATEAGVLSCSDNFPSQMSQLPYFKDHGSVYNFGQSGGYTAALVATNFSTLVGSNVRTGDWVIMTPTSNELTGTGCPTLASIKANYQSIWAQSHSLGASVAELTPIGSVSNPTFCASAEATYQGLNTWFRAQGKNSTNVASGQYWDRLVATDSLLFNQTDGNLIQQGGDPNPGHLTAGGAKLVAEEIGATLAGSISSVGSNLRDFSNPSSPCGVNNVPCTNTPNTFTGLQAVQTESPTSVGISVKGSTGTFSASLVNKGTFSGATVTPSSLVAGNQIIVSCQNGGSHGGFGVSDTQGNSYTVLFNNPGDFLAIANIASSSSSNVVTCTATDGGISGWWMQWNGLSTSGDGLAFVNNVPQSGAITTTQFDLIITDFHGYLDPWDTASTTSPWTVGTTTGTTNINAWQTGNAGSYNSNWTAAVSHSGFNYNTYTVAIKTAASVRQSANLFNFLSDLDGSTLTYFDYAGVFHGTCIGCSSGTLTTKGDIYTYSTTNARLPVGADGKVLGANSAQSTGLEWVSTLVNPMSTAGDIITGGSSGTPARLAAGASTQVLTSNGPGVAPSWQASSGGLQVFGNFQITLPASSISANTCTADTPVSVPGASATSSAAITGPGANSTAVTGWGSSGGLKLNTFITTDTFHWSVCNQTTSSITPGALSQNVIVVGSTPYFGPTFINACSIGLSGSSTTTVNCSMTTTSGHMYVAYCRGGSGPTGVTLTSSPAITFTGIGFQNSGGSYNQGFYALTSTASGSTTFTCTANASNTFQGIAVMEYNPGSITALDTSVHNGPTASGATWTSSTFTTSAKGIVVACADPLFSASSTWPSVVIGPSSATARVSSTAFNCFDVSTSAAQTSITAGATNANSGTWQGMVIGLK